MVELSVRFFPLVWSRACGIKIVWTSKMRSKLEIQGNHRPLRDYGFHSITQRGQKKWFIMCHVRMRVASPLEM
jgi:hypothetical protein